MTIQKTNQTLKSNKYFLSFKTIVSKVDATMLQGVSYGNW